MAFQILSTSMRLSRKFSRSKFPAYRIFAQFFYRRIRSIFGAHLPNNIDMELEFIAWGENARLATDVRLKKILAICRTRTFKYNVPIVFAKYAEFLTAEHHFWFQSVAVSFLSGVCGDNRRCFCLAAEETGAKSSAECPNLSSRLRASILIPD